MTIRILSLAFALILLLHHEVSAGALLYDDFEDGSVKDGSPVTWNEAYPPWNTGTREVVNGDYVLTPDVDKMNDRGFWETDSNVEGLTFLDFSLRTQARVLGKQNPVAVGFNARDTHPFSADGQTGHNIYAFLETDGAMHLGLNENNQSIGDELIIPTDLRPTDYDVLLRLDVVDETVKFWAWPAGDARPASPQLSLVLPGRPPTVYNHPGQVGVWNGQNDVDLSGVAVPVAFRYVGVVPEPSTLILGALLALPMAVVRMRRRTSTSP